MNLWDEITVRIYALIHVKEYRHKVAEDTTPKTKEYKKPKHNIDIAYEDFEEIGVDE